MSDTYATILYLLKLKTSLNCGFVTKFSTSLTASKGPGTMPSLWGSQEALPPQTNACTPYFGSLKILFWNIKKRQDNRQKC